MTSVAPACLACRGDVRGGVHGERRANHDEEVGRAGPPLRLRQDASGHGFAEEHRGRLHDSAAEATEGDIVARRDPRVDLVARVDGRAVETAHAGGVAMELDDGFGRQSGAAVEIVDVLGDAAVEAMEAIELGDGVVRGSRLGVTDHGVDSACEPPVPAPALDTHEVGVRHLAGVEAVPHTARTPC